MVPTRIRNEFGLEAAQILLGHSKADVTQIYDEEAAAAIEALNGTDLGGRTITVNVAKPREDRPRGGGGGGGGFAWVNPGWNTQPTPTPTTNTMASVPEEAEPGRLHLGETGLVEEFVRIGSPDGIASLIVAEGVRAVDAAGVYAAGSAPSGYTLAGIRFLSPDTSAAWLVGLEETAGPTPTAPGFGAIGAVAALLLLLAGRKRRG